MKTKTAAIAFGIIGLSSVQLSAAIVSGYIQVKNSSDVAIGYIANSYETLGEYGLTSIAANRLLVSFEDSSPTFSLSLLNSVDTSYGFLGAIVGYSTTNDYMGSGNPNYLYLGGTYQSAVGATPTVGSNSFSDASLIARNYESAIWRITGNALSYEWINPDASPVSLTAVARDNLVLLTGDSSVFVDTFGSGEVVSMNFIPIPEPSGLLIASVSGLIAATIRRKRN